HRAAAEIDAAGTDRVGVPPRSLTHHHVGRIDACDRRADGRRAGHVHAGSESNLEHTIAGVDAELRQHPLTPLAVLDRHQPTDDAAEPAGWADELRTHLVHDLFSRASLNAFSTAVARSTSAAGTPTSIDARSAASRCAMSRTAVRPGAVRRTSTDR